MIGTEPSRLEPLQVAMTGSSEQDYSALENAKSDITNATVADSDIAIAEEADLEEPRAELSPEQARIEVSCDEELAQEVPQDRNRQPGDAGSAAVMKEHNHPDADCIVGLNRNPDPSQWFYVPSWKRLPSLSPQPLCSRQHWLLLLDDQGLGQALADQLIAAGQQVRTAVYGERAPSQKADYFIEPGKGLEGFTALMQSLKDQIPHHILHLWSLSAELDLSVDRSAAQIEQYFQTLLFLAQAIDSVEPPYPVQLSVLSNGVYSLLGTEALNPFKSLLVGAVKVIFDKHPQIICRYLDLDEGLPKTLSQSQWMQMLLTELADPHPPIEVAYRGRSRWVPIYELTPLSKPVDHPRLRLQGVYLITGGLDGMGLTLARYLAQTLQAKLVLLSQAALPERSNWSSWCATHPNTDDIRQKIQQVQDLESWGATVWLDQVDIADAAAVQQRVTAAEAELGAIQGVIQCTSANFDGMNLGRSQDGTDRILAEKVTGTLVLDQIFCNHTLDFWVMSSSLSTILYKTIPNQVGYSAADEFLGAFCQYRQQTSQAFTVVIHWPEWEGNGDAVAPYVRESQQKGREDAKQNLIAITPEEGSEAFARILSQSQAQVMVTPQDLNLLLHHQSGQNLAPQSQLQLRQNAKWIGSVLSSIQNQKVQQETDLQSAKSTAPLTISPVNLIPEKPFPNGSSRAESFDPSRLNSPAKPDSLNGSSKIESQQSESSKSELQQSAAAIKTQPQVVTLHPGRSDYPPLFLVHPVSGDVSCYAALARYLNPDWPLFALRAIGLEPETLPLHNLTQMATRYVEAIRSHQPTGPYYLGGWSMGGVVAYEMSLQLQQAGESVEGLILIDSPAPVSIARDVVTDFNVFAKGLGFFLEQVKEISQSLRFRPSALEVPLQRLLEEGLRLNILPQDFTLERLRLLHSVFDAHSRALSTYTAASCSKRLPSLFLQAQVADNPQFSQLGPQAAARWSNLLGRSLFSRTLPGDHYSLIAEPQIVMLSTYLNGFLQQVKPAVRNASPSV